MRTPEFGRRSSLFTAAAMATLATLLAATGVTGTANAASSQPPMATGIGSVTVQGLQAPSGSNAPAVITQTGQSFSVTVTTVGPDDTGTIVPLPVSDKQDTTFTLSITAVRSGSPKLSGTTKVTVPAGQSSGTATGVVLTGQANGVVLTAKGSASLKDWQGSTAPFDVSLKATGSDSGATFWSTTGGTTPCAPDKTVGNRVCADLILPNGSLSGLLLTTGLCDSTIGCTSTHDQLQALVDLGTRYPNTSPATLVVKCDKSACPGGGVPSYSVLINLDPNGPLSSAPACTSKGVVDPGLSYCVDYVQSKRDNAGDLLLYLLFTQDARISTT